MTPMRHASTCQLAGPVDCVASRGFPVDLPEPSLSGLPRLAPARTPAGRRREPVHRAWQLAREFAGRRGPVPCTACLGSSSARGVERLLVAAYFPIDVERHKGRRRMAVSTVARAARLHS
jgi:hypothetical protein